MATNGTPFYAQINLLKRYIHSSDPGADPVAVEVILEMLRTSLDLRTYFFQSGPSAAWAIILYENGLFSSPPSPENTTRGPVLPSWDVQYYLQAIAPTAPDLVLKYISSIEKWHGLYIARALAALIRIPADDIVRAVPTILRLLENKEVAQELDNEVSQLIEMLSEAKKFDTAILLFNRLTNPDLALDLDAILGKRARSLKGFELLKQHTPETVVKILEEHLLMTLRYESAEIKNANYERFSWWRSAIEETDQDRNRDNKDELLCALRDTLESWIETNNDLAGKVVIRYLQHQHSILRRVALYILRIYPAIYSEQVAQQLSLSANLDDPSIHHEYFKLLEAGFSWLNGAQQQKVLAMIINGPDQQRVADLAVSVQQQRWIDPHEYAIAYVKRWIRDRLWMLRDHLKEDPQLVLTELIDEMGIPEHPDFIIYTSSFQSFSGISAVSEDELASMDPNVLVGYLNQLHPKSEYAGIWESEYYESVARSIVNVVSNDWERYQSHLCEIALIRPGYASEFLERWLDRDQQVAIPWHIALKLCRQILSSQIIYTEIDSRTMSRNWWEVRRGIAYLVEAGLTNSDRAIPVELLTDAKNLLLVLVDDPDPDLAADRPEQGYMGFDDPITIALNHVRPIALKSLIAFAKMVTQTNVDHGAIKSDNVKPVLRLEPDVKVVLTRKLNPAIEPSWAVRSIYGQHLNLLFGLDQEWLQEHIDEIFPIPIDDQREDLFVVAMTAYCYYHYHWFYPSLLDILRPKYEKMIEYLKGGDVYKSGEHLSTLINPQVLNYFAMHITWEYILADYELFSPAGQSSLIVAFIHDVPIENRDATAWACWRICEDNPAKLHDYWPRVRKFLEWRLSEAVSAQHSPEFDKELEQLAHLIILAPDHETLTTLRPIIEGLVPHVARNEYRNFGWDAIEKYLAKQVARDPVQAIKLYRLMHDYKSNYWWSYREDETKLILEVAAADPRSRQDTLSFIDWLGRKGNYEYQYIYDLYAR